MKRSQAADTERILQCYMRRKGRYYCKGCELTGECRKLRRFIKDKATYHLAKTHTSRMMNFYAGNTMKN